MHLGFTDSASQKNKILKMKKKWLFSEKIKVRQICHLPFSLRFVVFLYSSAEKFLQNIYRENSIE